MEGVEGESGVGDFFKAPAIDRQPAMDRQPAKECGWELGHRLT